MATIRAPRDSDAAAISELLAQLGYPVNATEIPGRLAALRSDPDAASWVAEVDGMAAGIATAHVIQSLHKSEPVAMLTVLVVSEDLRGRGVGRQLVRRAEEWAAARRASAITLTSALRRTDAHAFYRALGYDQTGVRLGKALTPVTP